MVPSVSVMRKTKFEPAVISVCTTASGSGMPSPAVIVFVVEPSANVIAPPFTELRTAEIELDRLKVPMRLAALLPTESPVMGPLYERYQIKQVPGPAALRLKGPLPGGIPRITPLASVMR